MSPKYSFNARDLIKTGKFKPETLLEFKKWCDSEKRPDLNQQQQILFLSCADNLQEAQQVARRYFQCRSAAPELFANLDLEGADCQQGFSVL